MPSLFSSPAGEVAPPLVNSSELHAAVSHLGPQDVHMVIRILVERVFSRQELETQSITGKRTIKSGDLPRSPLDQTRFQHKLTNICFIDLHAMILLNVKNI
jgi:hypothetical protein